MLLQVTVLLARHRQYITCPGGGPSAQLDEAVVLRLFVSTAQAMDASQEGGLAITAESQNAPDPSPARENLLEELFAVTVVRPGYW
ncbi:MAG: hypothetical protein FJX77_01600 [Armatimonadetes bacterium]|nr:hypothetical protein [Armatimonadota bacterium]